MSRDERTRLWEGRIEDFLSSGLTVEDWCRANGVSKSTLYKWRKEFSRAASSQSASISTQTHPGWVQLMPANVSTPPVVPESTHECNIASLQIKFADMTVDVHRGFDPVLLKQIVEVLRSC